MTSPTSAKTTISHDLLTLVNQAELDPIASRALAVFTQAAKEGVSLYLLLREYHQIHLVVTRGIIELHSDDDVEAMVLEAHADGVREGREAPRGSTKPPGPRATLKDPSDLSPLGKRMVAEMIKQRVSFATLAKTVGVSVAAARFWTTGFRNPTDDNVARVAKVLGVSYSYLRGEG